MKKNLIPAAAMAVAVLLGASAISSCKSDKNAKQADTAAIEEMVEAVEAAPSDTARYNAAFFQDIENKSDVASDSTYAQTPSGLKYVVVEEGNGASPTADDAVTVHYTGKLTDGTVFDSSYTRDEPITFPLKQVIKGWTEGLQLMKEGGTTIFYIPSELGYGATGTPGGPIPPDANLIFEVKLIKVEKIQ